MKFAKKLQAHLTPEWHAQYVDYDALKDILEETVEGLSPSEEMTDPEILRRLDAADIHFFEKCENSLNKVEGFYIAKYHEALLVWNNLRTELGYYWESVTNKPPHFASTAVSRSSLGTGEPSAQTRSLRRKNTQRDNRRSVQVDENEPSVRIRRYSRDSQASIHIVKTFRKNKDLQTAFSEYYLSLVLLQNYQYLNMTGFRKIIKKHDKNFWRTNGAKWLAENVHTARFHDTSEVEKIISEVENEFTEKFAGGDRGKAMERLRVPPLSERHSPHAVFRFGFFAGIFFVEVIVIALTCIFLRPLPSNWIPAMRMFRSTFMLIFFLGLIGVNTYGWRLAGVNHVLIFGIDPRSHLNHYELLEAAFFMATMWGCAVLYFLYSSVLQTPAYLSPFVLIVFMLLCLFNPLEMGYRKARLWLLKILGRICMAPLFRVTFADFWLADQLNSLNFVFADLATYVCFYASQLDWSNGMLYLPVLNSTDSTLPSCANSPDSFLATSCQCKYPLFSWEPILVTLPAWFRFAQCVRRFKDADSGPHLLNAGKYSMTFFVTISQIWLQYDPGVPAFLSVILSFTVNATYTYCWDVHKDWGLLELKYKFLRKELVYRHTIYYFAIVEDLMLRFAWIIRVTLKHIDHPMYEHVMTILIAAEITIHLEFFPVGE